jgi:fatty acid-binding protein DegV
MKNITNQRSVFLHSSTKLSVTFQSKQISYTLSDKPNGTIVNFYYDPHEDVLTHKTNTTLTLTTHRSKASRNSFD